VKRINESQNRIGRLNEYLMVGSEDEFEEKRSYDLSLSNKFQAYDRTSITGSSHEVKFKAGC
jgi:hypothetical protein